MHDLPLAELANELDRAAEDAAGNNDRGNALRLLRFAASLRHLQTVSGVNDMGAVADTIHKLKQQITAANADRDAAKADAAKAQADVDRLNSLTAAGRVLDDADVAALAEANAANAGPGDTTPVPGDSGANAAPGGDGAAVAPQTPAEAPATTGTAPATAPDQPTA